MVNVVDLGLRLPGELELGLAVLGEVDEFVEAAVEWETVADLGIAAEVVLFVAPELLVVSTTVLVLKVQLSADLTPGFEPESEREV